MTSSVPPYDGPPVAVIGNGANGQTAALLLARWGIPVVVVDQRRERDPVGSKAICQQRDVLDVWEAVGAGRRIAEEGTWWTTARTFYRDQEILVTTLTDRGRSPFPPFVNISQTRTEAILDEQMAASPLIDVRWGHEVSAIQQDDEGVTLTCQTADGPVTLHAAYALACAGARGDEIRAMLGVSLDGRTFDDQFLVCDIQTELPDWSMERRFYFDPVWNPDRQVLIHPCPDATFRIDWQVPPEFDLREEEATGQLEQRIRKIIGDLPYKLVWNSVYRFHSRHVARMRVGRVLLVGDCAHLVAPFGARGLNSGVLDGENAAWKIAFVLRGWAPDSLLESYHDERLAAALENIEITSATMRFLVPQDEAEWARRREILRRAVTDPRARDEIDSGRMAEPFWYVDSPLTTADPTRPFPGRPPKGEPPVVVPGVLVPDAPIRLTGQPQIRRLREIVRDGLLVLTTGDVDPGAAAAAARAAGPAPVRALRLADIDVEEAVAAALGTRDDEVWLIRPDGHVAAVLPAPGGAVEATTVTAATRRALGFT